MKTRNVLLGIVILVAVISPLAWWLAAPLFRDDTVDEAFPFEVPTAAEIEAMSAAEAEVVVADIMAAVEASEMDEAQMETLEETVMAVSAKMPEHEMAEGMPEAAAEWVEAARGTFRDADSFHQGSGTATIFQLDERRVLRFEEFSVTNGPDLHVLLVENIDGTGQSSLGDYIDLGSLKGNMGNQNYEIAADVDLTRYSGVMIYCMPFHVVFATAPFDN